MKIKKFKENIEYVSPLKDDETGLYIYPGEDNEVKAKDIPSEYFPKVKIIVDSEQSKEQILKALEYIHYLSCIDSKFMAVNSIMHMYLFPDSVEVNVDYNFDYGKQI